ncbi:MAG: hypothetical protein GXX85_11355 [Ignavibacteria bacterium]|nr:hypothetical protein [Ignavibacteria bacterium]
MISNQKPGELKSLIEHLKSSNWIPEHICSKNLKIIAQVHSVNTMHNIVIAQTKQCKICGKKFEESNPEGIK